MIRFEDGMLALDSKATKEDENAVIEYANSIRLHERQRILNLLKKSDSVCNEWAIALIEDKFSA
jgi:hypothetical protein